MMGFKNPDKPEFWPLSLRISEITQKNQKELQLKFVCKLRDYDDPEQKHKYLGEFQATYQELQVGKEFSCEPPVSLCQVVYVVRTTYLTRYSETF